MDYGKFKYESALKARESRKNQAQTVIKEIKIRPKIDPHDYGTKRGHVERFLRQGDKVKVTIMFRGREQSRPELGYKLLQRLAVDVEELGFVESQPKQDGRNMIMVIGPHRKKADTRTVRGPERASARAAAPTAASSLDELMTMDAAAFRESVASSVGAMPVGGASAEPSNVTENRADPQEPPAAMPRPSRPAAQAAAARPAPAAPAAPSPSAPRPASAAPRPGPAAGNPAPAAPRPGPADGEAVKPAAPRPGPAGGDAAPAAPRPAAPRPSGPRPAAPKPAAPKPSAPRSAPKPGDTRPVPGPRPRAAEHGAAPAETGR